MKIKINNEVITVYLYNYELNLVNNLELTKQIKEVLNKIMKLYEIDLSGMYNVIIYENKCYGYILEIVRIKEFEYSDFIDLKIKIKRDQPFYLIVDNYKYVENCHNVYFNNNLYVVNILELDNVNSVFEVGDIIYNDYSLIFNKSVKIK